jgi:predicted TIM-barrel fold metal-dependent hydrolase
MTLFDPHAKLDWHAHVYEAGVGVVEGARYAPAESALAQDFVSNFSSAGLEGGLLIQPSFLGTDNTQMVDAIASYPDKLKGIAVVNTDITADEIERFTSEGIIGCRLNLFGKDVPELRSPEWSAFLNRIEAADWQIELHAPPAYLAQTIPMLDGFHGDVVIDHFGRPDVTKGLEDPDYQRFLDCLDPKRHWVKTSGWYRLGKSATEGLERARASLKMLEERGMGDRLLWGSDWPHTQHEEITYSAALEAKAELGV